MASSNKGRRKTKAAASSRKNSTPAGSKFSSREGFHLLPTVSKAELLDDNLATDRKFRQFIYDLSVLGVHLSSARAYLASHIGISSPQYNIMMILAQYQGADGISGSEVASHLHVTTAFITSEISKLEGLGLVQKRPNPKDGRGVLLCLTELGEQKVQDVAPQRLWVNDHLFGGLLGNDFKHLAHIVASLVDDFTQTVDTLEIMSKERNRRAAGRDRR